MVNYLSVSNTIFTVILQKKAFKKIIQQFISLVLSFKQSASALPIKKLHKLALRQIEKKLLVDVLKKSFHCFDVTLSIYIKSNLKQWASIKWSEVTVTANRISSNRHLWAVARLTYSVKLFGRGSVVTLG